LADTIELRSIWAMGIHGVLPEEQTRPQPFEVDLDVESDLSVAARSDDVGDTIDYGALAERVVHIVSNEHFQLLERLAERIAEAVLADPRATSVTVAVRKLRPPVPVDMATAGVRITRP
jgi:dihydroneopterin aldolase